MKTSNFFLNPDNQHKLYVYEILNLNANHNLEIDNNAHNILFLGNQLELTGIFNNPRFNVNFNIYEINNENRSAEMHQHLNYQFFTNDFLDFFHPKKRFVFSLKPFEQISNQSQEFLIATDNTNQVYNDVNDLTEFNQTESIKLDLIQNQDYLLILELIPIIQNRVFQNMNYRFVKLEENTNLDWNNIQISLNNDCFIQTIKLIGDLVKENNSDNQIKNILLPIKNQDNILLIPFFVNPLNGDTKLDFYVSNFNPYQHPIIAELSECILEFETFDIVRFTNQETKDLVLDLIKTTSVLLNGFNGWNEQLILEFKQKYSSNNPEDYVNYKIAEFWKQHANYSNLLKSKICCLLLMLSQYIKGNHFFRGGLTSEHKLYLSCYLEWDETISTNFRLKSKYWTFVKENDTVNWQPIFNNISQLPLFEVDGQVLNPPVLPLQIENQIISNNPVDFNKYSFNFNYLTFLMISKNNQNKLQNLFSPVQNEYVYDEYFLPNQKVNLDVMGQTRNYFGVNFWNDSYYPIDVNKIKNAVLVHNNEVFDSIRQQLNLTDDVEILNNYQFSNLKLLKNPPGTDEYLEEIRPPSTGLEGGRFSGVINRTHWYNLWGGFDIRFFTKKRIDPTNEVYSLNFGFDYFKWRNFLVQKQLWETINLEFKLLDQFKNQNWKISKLRRIEISHILGQRIDLQIGDLKIQNLNLFSKLNEFNAKTIIKF